MRKRFAALTTAALALTLGGCANGAQEAAQAAQEARQEACLAAFEEMEGLARDLGDLVDDYREYAAGGTEFIARAVLWEEGIAQQYQQGLVPLEAASSELLERIDSSTYNELREECLAQEEDIE